MGPDGTPGEPPAAAPSAAPATGKSNWERMKADALQQSDAPAKHVHKPRPHKRRKATSGAGVAAQAVASDGVHDGQLVPKSADDGETTVVALDCEMVGVGNLEVKAKGRDALARVCVVCPALLREPDSAVCAVQRLWPQSIVIHVTPLDHLAAECRLLTVRSFHR